MNNRRTVALAIAGLPLISKTAETYTVPPAETNATSKIESRKVAPKDRMSEATASILSYTLYAEARGESYEGKRAVASVIATRAVMLKRTMAEICLHEKQFSSWNHIAEVPEAYVSGTYNNHTDRLARVECYGLAWELLTYQPRWDRYTHFYNPSLANPSWGSKLQNVKMIGNHVFGFMEPKYMPR